MIFTNTKNNAKTKRLFSLFGSEFITTYVVRGFFIGLIFPLIAWGIRLLFHEEGTIMSEIGEMHTEFPLLFMIDLFPFFLAVFAYIFAFKEERIKTELQANLKEEKENITRNARLAQMIGEKNFTLDIDSIEEDDALGRALLKMRNNLIETSEKEEELNWIARGKDKISNVLRQYNVIEELAYETLIALIDYIDATQGAFYIFDEDRKIMSNVAAYAYNRKKYVSQEFKIGEGLIGQAAYELDIIYRKEVPDNYLTISSGILGDQKPKTLLIVPLISDEKLQAIIEFAALHEDIPELTLKFVKELSEIIGQTIFNLKVNTKTEKLLLDAQVMTEELKQNEEALRKNAVEMKITQEELEKSNRNLESQIKEVENAQKRLYSLLENASEIISIYNENELVTYESPSVKRILGYAPEEIVGKNAFEEVHTLATDKLKRIFSLLLEDPSVPRTVEFQYKKDTGNVLWLETTGRNMLNDPAINGVIFNTRDITLRKIAEKAQRMSGEMQALSENSPDMIIRIGTNGKFYYVNPIVEKFTGVITNEIIGKTLGEVRINQKIINFFAGMLENVKETKEKHETETNFPTSPEERVMYVSAIPELNDDGELESVLFVAHDITERKNFEKELGAKNKAINDSINYAQRIQSAILPDNQQIREHLPNSFIFYKPRDVVSGDFPWFFVKENFIYIAAVDCTGHGVPGALLSVIAYFLLNNIVDHDENQTAAEILDILHQSVRKTLKQDRPDASARDGMDIAFCKINVQKRELQYSGAHRPLYFLKNGKIKQYRGNPKAIGGIPNPRRAEKKFTNHTIPFDIGDKIFFFSDGLPDQIGGAKGRKYQASRIRQIIEENSEASMIEYSRYFVRDFSQWKGENKQIDDVILIGIEF
ncbi:MAG: histidine kinase [Bacteroidia bacterium]|nr:MAG: histidine kinase [Bacteroidia bacterium]